MLESGPCRGDRIMKRSRFTEEQIIAILREQETVTDFTPDASLRRADATAKPL
jgi:hypothetical protein